MMIKKDTILSVALVFSLAFNLAFAGIWAYHFFYVKPRLAEAEEEDQSDQERVLGRVRELARRRGLSEDMRAARKRVQEARTEFLRLMQDPRTDREELRQAQQKLAGRQEAVRKMVFEHLLEIRGNLNESQRRALGRMLRRRRQRSPGTNRGRSPRRGGYRENQNPRDGSL
jgi:hypothetical protein